MNQMFHALQALENNALLQLTGIPPPGYTETSIAEIFAMRPAPNVYFYTRHADDAPSHFSRAFRDQMEPPTVWFFNVTSTGLGYWAPWNMTAFTTALAREAFQYGFGGNGQIPQGNPVLAPAANAPMAAFPAIAQIQMEFNAVVAQQVAPEALEMQALDAAMDAAMDAAEDTAPTDQEEMGIIAPIPMEFNAAVAQQVAPETGRDIPEALEMEEVDAAMDAAEDIASTDQEEMGIIAPIPMEFNAAMAQQVAPEALGMEVVDAAMEDTAPADQEEVGIIAPIPMEFNAAMAQQVAPETGHDIPEALEMKEVDAAMDAAEDIASTDQEEVVAQNDAELDDAAPAEDNLESEQGDELAAVEQQLEEAGNLAEPAEEEPKEETEEEVLCAMEEQKKSHAEKMAKLTEKLERVQQTTTSLPPSQLQSPSAPITEAPGLSSMAPTSATPSSSTSEQGLPSFELDLDLFQSRSLSPAPADDEEDSKDEPTSSTTSTGPSPSASSSSLPPPVQKRKYGVQTATKMRIEALLEHHDTKRAMGYLHGEPHVLYDDHDEERRGKDTQQVRPFEEVTAESFVTFAKRGGVDISAGEARERLALFQSVRRKQVKLRLIKSEKKPSSVAARTNRKSKTTRKRKNEDEDFVYIPMKTRKYEEPRKDDDGPGASGAGMVY